MINLTAAQCPNCGADIKVDPDINAVICEYCGSKILVDNALKKIKRKKIAKDETYEKCIEISKKLNLIFELYVGNKNEMLLMLKDRIGLVNSHKTTAKIEMMKSANTYDEVKLEDEFTYRIADRTLDHFEYKRDGSVELTYESGEDGYFALEYYGKILKYTDIDELSRVLDEIIEEVKLKFKEEQE